MRLQKFLAQASISSRRKAEDLITAGKISVNGQVVTALGTTVDPDNDTVTYRDKPVRRVGWVYLALHKPTGYISSTDSTQGKTVMDLLPKEIKTQRVFPVGRLDKDSSGLLLLTNDGAFAQRVTHASFGCEKEYFVTLDQDFRPEDIARLKRGMRLDGPRLVPLQVLRAHNSSLQVVLRQGVHRQIRRMLGRLGYTVVKLKRVRVGALPLGTLAEGGIRKFQPNDVIPNYR